MSFLASKSILSPKPPSGLIASSIRRLSTNNKSHQQQQQQQQQQLLHLQVKYNARNRNYPHHRSDSGTSSSNEALLNSQDTSHLSNYAQVQAKPSRQSPLLSIEEENNVQQLILSADSIENLVDLYTEYKSEMNLINECTCLQRALKLQDTPTLIAYIQKAKGSSSTSSSLESTSNNPHSIGGMILEIVAHLESQIENMKGFTASNYLSNIVKLKLHNPTLIARVANLAVTNDWPFSTTQTSFLIWSLATANIRNESYIQFSTKKLLEVKGNIKPQDIANIFMGLGKLKYFDDSVTKLLESQILLSSAQFTLDHINMVFMSYEKFYKKNVAVLDALSKQYMSFEEKLTFRNLSNILVSCSNMHYTNQELLNFVEQALLKKIKKADAVSASETLEQQNSQERDVTNEDPTTYEFTSIKKKMNSQEGVETLDPTNATMILLAYCKLKVVKTELFEVLEANFAAKLDQASSKDVVTYSHAHSMLCTELFSSFYASKNHSNHAKKSLNNIRKYNHYFYQMVLPFIELNLHEYSSRQLQVIFASASKPQVKKRAICKQLISIGIKSIPKLASEFQNAQQEKQNGGRIQRNPQGNNPKETADIELAVFKHFQLLTNFAYTESIRREMIQAFVDADIPIEPIVSKFSHLMGTNIQNDSSNISGRSNQGDKQDNYEAEQEEEEEEEEDREEVEAAESRESDSTQTTQGRVRLRDISKKKGKQ